MLSHMLMTDANFIMSKEIFTSRREIRYSEIWIFRTYRIFYIFPGSQIRSIKVVWLKSFCFPSSLATLLIMSFFNENFTFSIDLLSQFIWRYAQNKWTYSGPIVILRWFLQHLQNELVSDSDDTKLNAARYLLSTVSSILYNIPHYIATYIDYKYTGGTLFSTLFWAIYILTRDPFFQHQKKFLIRKLAKMTKMWSKNMTKKFWFS